MNRLTQGNTHGRLRLQDVIAPELRGIQESLDGIDKRFDTIDRRFSSLEHKMTDDKAFSDY